MAGVPLFRIFVASPVDVALERRQTLLIINRLAADYRHIVDIQPYLWEYEPMTASGHFQDVILPPSAAQVVVLILWSTLGSFLPKATDVRRYEARDGRSPVRGSEWEYEDAKRAQGCPDAPQIIAFRKTAKPMVPLPDPAAYNEVKRNWDAVEEFWSREFRDKGTAHRTYDEIEAFCERLEGDLRQLIERNSKTLRARTAHWLKGNPFPGLTGYDFEHAEVFFGRNREIRAGVEAISRGFQSEFAFLPIVGGSGSGKSSLAKAGILPALFLKGVVPDTGMWRRCILRPGTTPFGQLALAITGEHAVPELLAIDNILPALERHAEQGSDDLRIILEHYLADAEQRARRRGQILPHETLRMAFVVDQLEELFTKAQLPEAKVRAFLSTLISLAQSRRICVITTIRGDQLGRFLDVPKFADSYSASTPLRLDYVTSDGIESILRRVADIAGIEFEESESDGIDLAAHIRKQCDGTPGALPLLSFLMEEMYAEDIERKQGSTLTFATMNRLGGLSGSIAERAARVFSSLPIDVRDAFPTMMQNIVRCTPTGEAVAHAVDLRAFQSGGITRQLISAFLAPEARLLVTSQGTSSGPVDAIPDARPNYALLRFFYWLMREIRRRKAGPADHAGHIASDRAVYVSVAHEALLTHWKQAKEWIEENQGNLQILKIVEDRFLEWSEVAPGAAKRKLLLRWDEVIRARRAFRNGLSVSDDIRRFVTRSALARAGEKVWLLIGKGFLYFVMALIFVVLPCMVAYQSGRDESDTKNRLAALAGEAAHPACLKATSLPIHIDAPVGGRIVSDFAPQEDAGNDGIDIAAAAGEPFFAAENGIVAYAGRFGSYGRIVMLRHGEGYTTVYSHGDDIRVEAGEQVSRGDVLGVIAPDEGGRKSYLHFELRCGTSPLNPMDYLNSQ